MIKRRLWNLWIISQNFALPADLSSMRSRLKLNHHQFIIWTGDHFDKRQKIPLPEFRLIINRVSTQHLPLRVIFYEKDGWGQPSMVVCMSSLRIEKYYFNVLPLTRTYYKPRFFLVLLLFPGYQDFPSGLGDQAGRLDQYRLKLTILTSSMKTQWKFHKLFFVLCNICFGFYIFVYFY